MGVKRRQLVLFGMTLLSVGLYQNVLYGQDVRKLRSLLREITLRVLTPGGSGSGVIIRQSGKTYVFLTAKHVLDNASAGEEVYVVTSDGTQHGVNLSSSQKASSSDLAIASFSSSKNYRVASLGNSDQMQELDPIVVSGFPSATRSVPNPTIKISRGEIEQVGTQSDGYGLGYSANTQPGMSGGPVMDSDGNLIAIHGRADGERIGSIRVKQGSNWAVPIKTAIAAFSLTSSRVNSQEIKPEPEPESSNGLKTFSFQVVSVDKRGQISNRQQKSAQYLQEDLGNDVTLDMVLIPGGRFTMGSPSSEAESDDVERPQHEVTVPAFAMGRYAITQAQWQAIMGNNPSSFKGDRRPVERVNWNEAVEFCQKLSEQSEKDYRLPSESEWEYACRAGSTTPFSFGASINPELVNYDGRYPYAQAPKGEYREQTTDVGSFPPNSFGLYDMHGNVREWCLDQPHKDYTGAPVDGSAWVSGGDSERRITRGGSWGSNPWYCRSATRDSRYPLIRHYSFGFRVSCSSPRSLQ